MKKRITIGIDEVGRGALAGPVVLAAVVLTGRVRWQHPKLGRIRDSKKLTPKRREIWCAHLKSHPNVRWAVARVGHGVIDRINIARAANCGAFRLARRMTNDFGAGPHFFWLDGGLVLPDEIPHQTVIKGDEKIPIIAAASIIAKVSRDRMMTRLSKKFPAYGFQAHKGYGTKFHKAAIAARGPSKIHRRTFLA